MAEPFHRGALDVSLAAHRHLESESKNFWLTAWLRKQIAALEEKRKAAESSKGTGR
jgi:hypothetical protein